ncbi:UNC-like C-terminal-domain-containing protein [Mortierella sp. GBAus27b]|nr:UNC-like C-terminal-domain-containing protein [Mortierella sp. GBAus27b]
MATVSAIVFIPRLCISSASLHPSWLQGQGTRVVWSIKQSIRAFYLSKRICMLILVALAVGSTYYIDAYLTDLPGYPDIHGPKHDSLATISRIPRTFITTITRRFKELSAWYPSSLPKRRQQRMRSNKNTGTGMGMSDHQLAIEQLQKSTHQLAKHVEKLQKSDYQQADHIEQLQRSRHQQAKSIESLQESDNQKTNHIEQIQRSHHQLVKDFESTKQLDRRITSTEHQLNTLKSYINDGQWVNQVLDALWDKLPEHLAVSKDLRTGKIQVSPEFLGLVKSMFVTKREVYEYFDEALGHHFPGESLNQWQKFLKDNDQALKSTSRHYLKVSKDEYLKVLDSEARAIWDGIKDAVTDSLATLPHHNLTDLVYQVTMKLLGEASGRSSLDLVTERDYALSTIGGEIIPEMTFPDFEVQMKPTLLGRLGLKYLISPNPQVEKRAIRAIEDDISPASCWAMKGDQGQIGIQLARKIIATHITIEHSDPRVTLDASSAPREMEIWMLPSSPDTSTRDRGYRHARQRETTDGPPERGASLLTKIEYHNPSATTKGGLPNIVQSFPIPSPEQNDPAVGVVIRIKSNWGHPDFTCIYRIRVHGHEP